MVEPSTPTSAPESTVGADLTAQEVTVGAQDLPLHCPGDKAPAWSLHPRVFLDVTKTGEVRCPYCGTLYKLAAGTVLSGHGH
jgi:uncharacterized Zn-finger protein